jgi:hypothetical protein
VADKWQQQRREEGWRRQREEGKEGVGRRQTSGDSDEERRATGPMQ